MKKLEINKEDLKYNIEKIREIAKENSNGKEVPKIIGVVKGNGIGLGLEQYAKFLSENDINILAVANFEEAIKLREFGIETEILMLSPIIDIESLAVLIEKKIILTISSLENLIAIEEIVESNPEILEIKVHLKIDTGFSRYGMLFTNTDEILNVFKGCKKVKVIGTYTHFSKPMDTKWTNLQFSRFMDVIQKIKKEGFNPGMQHVCSSTGFLKYPNMHLDAVRIGSAIQGRTLLRQNEFKKIGIFKTNVLEVKQLPKGYNVSYNNAYKTKKDTKIAVIPVGYMDGFNRNKLRDDFSFSNNLIAVGMEIKKIFKDNSLKVLINNKKYDVIGKLGMYHAIVDITGNDDIKIGDTAILDMTPLQTNEEIRREYI